LISGDDVAGVVSFQSIVQAKCALVVLFLSLLVTTATFISPLRSTALDDSILCGSASLSSWKRIEKSESCEEFFLRLPHPPLRPCSPLAASQLRSSTSVLGRQRV